MRPALQREIENTIASATGEPSLIVKSDSTSGGCINDAMLVELRDGRRYFVKSHPNAPPDMFEAEAKGLILLAKTEAIGVPSVIGWQNGAQGFLVLQAIESSPKQADYSQTMGRQLAQLHRSSQTAFTQGVNSQSDGRSSVSTGRSFGLSHDNYLGSTRQLNTWDDHWVSFWRDQRFGYQFKLARQCGYADSAFNRLADRLQKRLDELLVVDEPPCLIHGDLWSGNHMVGAAGEPILIDPAVYFAHREAEFGMTTLFGGFNASFYDAYHEFWPLAAGHEDRITLYRLYHLLNHLNLFGHSYLGQCLEIMKNYA